MLVPNLTIILLSVRAVDRRGRAEVFVGDGCYILSDGEAVFSSGVLGNASVIGSVNESENYVLKVTPVNASVSAASKRMDGVAKLSHRRFNYLGFENFKRVVGMVDGILASVADAKRILGMVCVPCVDGKMARSPHHRSTETSSKCELVHTDVDGSSTESLGASVYFITLMEDSTGFITATPLKTKKMGPGVIKARKRHLETLTGLKEKRVRHGGAKEYVSHDLKAWYDNKGITCAVSMGEDNKACLALVKNPEATGRTKHEDFVHHMVRDCVARGDVTFYFLPSAEMPADGLTKALPGPAIKAFRDAAGAGPDGVYMDDDVQEVSMEHVVLAADVSDASAAGA